MSNIQNHDSENRENDSKDEKISELLSKLESLKKVSKDYDSLNSQYKELLNNFDLMKEAKLRLEYEIHQRESEYNRRISDLKAENETMKSALNDKMTNSQKIFSENDTIEKEIELKNKEIENLRERLNVLLNQYDINTKNRNNLFDFTQNMQTNILTQKEQICKLKEDNVYLNKVVQENEKYLKLGENDIHNLSKQLNENNYDLQNLNKKVIFHEKSLNNLQNQLNSNNNVNFGLQNKIKNMQEELIKERNVNAELNNEIIIERNLLNDIANENERLKNILSQKEMQINQFNKENENLKLINAQYNKYKNVNKIRNDNLKNQVSKLEYQNNTLIKEIDNIMDEDRRMKEIINRKERINYLLIDNNNNLERSIYDLDKYNNYYGKDYPNNTRYTYHYYDYEHNF